MTESQTWTSLCLVNVAQSPHEQMLESLQRTVITFVLNWLYISKKLNWPKFNQIKNIYCILSVLLFINGLKYIDLRPLLCFTCDALFIKYQCMFEIPLIYLFFIIKEKTFTQKKKKIEKTRHWPTCLEMSADRLRLLLWKCVDGSEGNNEGAGGGSHTTWRTLQRAHPQPLHPLHKARYFD